MRQQVLGILGAAFAFLGYSHCSAQEPMDHTQVYGSIQIGSSYTQFFPMPHPVSSSFNESKSNDDGMASVSAYSTNAASSLAGAHSFAKQISDDELFRVTARATAVFFDLITITHAPNASPDAVNAKVYANASFTSSANGATGLSGYMVNSSWGVSMYDGMHYANATLFDDSFRANFDNFYVSIAYNQRLRRISRGTTSSVYDFYLELTATASMFGPGEIDIDGEKTVSIGAILLPDGTTPESHGYKVTFASGLISPNVPEPSSACLLALALISVNRLRIARGKMNVVS